MSNNFFQEQREQSLIKAKIVVNYFSAWSKIILASQKRNPRHVQRMAYIDLFAGPGRYDDQSKSTPLLVLETILNDPELSDRMVTWFNDKDQDNIDNLKQAISELPGIESLRFAPRFFNVDIGDEIAEIFKQKTIIPTFFFVDPWGYKGLSLKLISSIIKDWGCDCVFFFNYNRVNMGVNNDIVQQHMISLFGEERLQSLQRECKGIVSADREFVVIQALCDSLKQNGSQFVLPFRFRNVDGTRTSHHLVFISKSFRGYDIMKDIMYRESSEKKSGVATFEYNPRNSLYKQGSLFDLLSTPLDELEQMLLAQYSGRTIDFDQLYEEHSVDRPYVRKNYKEVLRKLYDEGRITALNPDTQKPPRSGTFSDKMRITFGD